MIIGLKLVRYMAQAANISKIARGAIWALEIALVVLACFWLGRAVITFLEPKSVWTDKGLNAPITTNGTASGKKTYDFSFDAFNRASSDQDELNVQAFIEGLDAPETSLNLKLRGRRSGDSPGVIIETPDGKQRNYYVDDEIINGVILKSVHPDYVVISRGGTLERLTFDKDDRTKLTQPSETQRAAQTRQNGALTVENFLKSVSILPVRDGTNIKGLRISSKGANFNLGRFGLRNGDVVTKIGDRELTGDITTLQSIMQDANDIFTQNNEIDATVLRNGKETRVRIKL